MLEPQQAHRVKPSASTSALLYGNMSHMSTALRLKVTTPLQPSTRVATAANHARKLRVSRARQRARQHSCVAAGPGSPPVSGESAAFAELRRDTPGCATVKHFNNAGSSLPPHQVLDAVTSYLRLEAQIGGYEAAEQSAAELQRPYTALATMLNCVPEEIAVVSSATAAWQQVFYGLPLRQGQRILCSRAEYGSNYIAFLQVCRRSGAVVESIPDDAAGDIDLQALEAACARQPPPALVSISHIPTGSGGVYNAAGVGQIARRYGIPYLLDACQSVGQLPLDVQLIGCDFLSATGRKYLRGPRGSGFLFASRHGSV